jgi:phosphatidate cytidylyltransferase
MALNFKTLLTRTLTAAVFVAVLLFCINYNYLSFSILFLVVAVWGLIEFYQIAEKLGAKPFKVIGCISAFVIYLVTVFNVLFDHHFFDNYHIFSLSFVGLFLIFIIGLFSSREKPVLDIVYTVGGIIYAVLPFALLNEVGCIQKTHYNWEYSTGSARFTDLAPYNPHFILGIVLLIWANDTFAYLVGSMIGKNKLCERISPGKTWEGTIGGGILTLGCSYIIAVWYPELQWNQWIVVAAIVVIFGTFGDLVESMLKRQAGIKDSGSIMPGHGGILDRFDSLLFVSPFVYAYLNLIQA